MRGKTVWLLHYDGCEEHRVEDVFADPNDAKAWADAIDNEENKAKLEDLKAAWRPDGLGFKRDSASKYDTDAAWSLYPHEIK